MKKFLQILIVGLLFNINIVSASSLSNETNAMITRIGTVTAELSSGLGSFNTYLANNKTRVINALNIDKLKAMSAYLQASDYNNAFLILENAMNDTELTNIGIATKINNYFTLKRDLINFIKTNQAALSIDTCVTECECSLDLLNEIKNSFNSLRPKMSTTIEGVGEVISGVIKKEINSKKNSRNSEISTMIDNYKELGSLLTGLVTSYTNSLDAYAEVFDIVGGNEALFNTIIRNKFAEELQKLLTNMDADLKDPIDDFVESRWDKLESNVDDLIASDKTIPEKNEAINEKINQVTTINEKFVSAINEIIGDLDIESIKTKINAILERGNTEFENAKKYLKDHLITDPYDINLVENHDEKVNINRTKEILILDKLFGIAEFKRQVELSSNMGTLVFELGNYDKVPNKAIVKVTENDETLKEYKVIVRGDVNSNGAITVTDVVMTAYYALDSIELDADQVMAADANGNNLITVTDVYMIAMKALEGDE